jgi:DivIVA domain-containing protein
VALDRPSIEKKDFPLGDRGYDAAAVDAHLTALADEVEELKRSAGGRGQSLAATASERIRAIVEGAETTAAEIQRQAEEDAGRIRTDAGNDASAIRQQAKERAYADVGKVSESTAGMLSRLEAMKGELNALFESLRTGSERLQSELNQLEGHMGQVRKETGAPEPNEPHAGPISPQKHAAYVGQGVQHAAAPAPPSSEEPTQPRAPQQPRAPEQPRAPGQPDANGEPAPRTQPGGPATGDDTEGARLIALNMALNGTPREETERYLAENFKLRDRDGLLDEVYESVER